MRNHIVGAGKVMLVLLALLAGMAGAQTPIYRSVQPGVTAAIGTGTGTLTISGSIATFSVSQPDSVGVGDAIQYDSDGNGSIDAICFIHGRTSGMEYTVKNAAGAAPTAVTGDEDWDIFRAYTSWANMEAGTENTGIDDSVEGFDTGNRNIVTATEVWNVAFYPGTDMAQVNWAGWNINATYYVRFFTPYLASEVGRSMRHSGVLTSKCYKIQNAASVFLDGTNISSVVGFRFEGLQIEKLNGAGSAINIRSGFTTGEVRISNCIIKIGTHTTNTIEGINIGQGTRTVKIWNNILYSGNVVDVIDISGFGGNHYIFGNTIITPYRGIVQASVTVVAKNNIVQASNDGFVGSFSSSDYNLSSLASDAPGGNSINSTSLTFENAAGNDYHLTSADAEIAVGTDLSGDANLPFSTDIDGDTRTTWNMGADEFVGSGSVSGGSDFFRRRSVR